MINRKEVEQEKILWHIIGTIVLLGLLALGISFICSGCATYSVEDKEGKIITSGKTFGFLRTITVKEKYDSTGEICIERLIITESNSKEVLAILNELIDTTVNTASKLKP